MQTEQTFSAVNTFVREKSRIVHLILDASGTVTQANTFARLLVGSDVMGLPFRNLAVSFLDPVDPVHAVAQGDVVPMTIAARDGLPRTMHFTFLREGDLIHAFGETPGEDIETLQKSLMATNSELSNMARELQKSNAELRKLHEIKNQFLGMAAHDLRNPIGAIMGYSDFLLEEAVCLTPEQTDFLHIIKSSSSYMLALLDDLLDIAKIEAGRLDLNIVETDFLDLMKHSVKLNTVMAEKKGIRLSLKTHESIPALAIDPLKVEQVLNNLISNAVKYSSSGTEVAIHVFMVDGHVIVEVRDQGQGIPKDKLHKIFQPFNRVSSQGTAGERSTGLGLAIVQKIVLGHQGRIWVESREKEGSTFYFSLPSTRRIMEKNP